MDALTRRIFLHRAGAAGAAVGLAPMMRAYAATDSIEWWNPHGAPAFIAEWDQLLAAFEDETGVGVVNSIVGWGDLVPRLTQAGMSGTLPDIATGGSGFPQIFASQGILADVSDTLAAIEASGSMVSGSAVLAASYEGKPYGVPRYTATNGVTFRTDILEEAGIEPPDPTGDRYAFGWEEFAEVCERLTNAPDRYALAAAGTTFDAEKVIWNFLVTNEATILDENGDLAWENDRTVETYRYLADIFRRFAPPAIATYDLAAANLAFMTGKAAMTYGDGDVHADIESAQPDWLGSVRFMPSPVKSIRAGYGGGVTFMIPDGDNVAEAGSLAQFLLRPDHLVRAIWPFRLLVTPATDTARQSELLKSDPAVQRWAKVLDQMAAVGANLSGVAQYHAASPEAGSIESSGILSKTMQKILVNDMDPEQAVVEATPEFQELLDG